MKQQYKRLLGFGLLLVILGIAGFLVVDKLKKPPHYHAGFRIYINNQLQDYSNDRFMQPEVCGTEGRIHLHNHIGDVAHIHADGVTWQELFDYLGVPVPSDPKYAQVIKPNESVVVLINSDQEVAEPVSQARIQEAESQTEACGTS